MQPQVSKRVGGNEVSDLAFDQAVNGPGERTNQELKSGPIGDDAGDARRRCDEEVVDDVLDVGQAVGLELATQNLAMLVRLNLDLFFPVIVLAGVGHVDLVAALRAVLAFPQFAGTRVDG